MKQFITVTRVGATYEAIVIPVSKVRYARAFTPKDIPDAPTMPPAFEYDGVRYRRGSSHDWYIKYDGTLQIDINSDEFLSVSKLAYAQRQDALNAKFVEAKTLIGVDGENWGIAESFWHIEKELTGDISVANL